jgi:hypothetical protein
MEFLRNNFVAFVTLGVLVAFMFASDNNVTTLGAVTNFDSITLDNDLVVGDDVTIGGTMTALEMSEVITADNTITLAESGTTYYVSTNVSTSTLPAVATATGTVYRFVIAGAIATNDFRVVSAEGDNIEGSLIVAGAVVDCDAADRINFVTDGENIGDFVEVRSDGQKWFVTQSNVLTTGKLTCSG